MQVPRLTLATRLQGDVIDGAFCKLQEQLQEDRRLLPEAARMHAAFLDAVITQAFLDDAPIMSLVGRLMQSALHLPELAAVGPSCARALQMLPVQAVCRVKWMWGCPLPFLQPLVRICCSSRQQHMHGRLGLQEGLSLRRCRAERQAVPLR